MEVAIAGGHGKIARRLTRLLAARGDRVRSLIRNPAHADDVRSDGAEPVICDVEHATPDEIAAAIAGAVLDAVLHEPRSVHRTLYVAAGEDPIAEALATALG